MLGADESTMTNQGVHPPPHHTCKRRAGNFSESWKMLGKNYGTYGSVSPGWEFGPFCVTFLKKVQAFCSQTIKDSFVFSTVP